MYMRSYPHPQTYAALSEEDKAKIRNEIMDMQGRLCLKLAHTHACHPSSNPKAALIQTFAYQGAL